MTTRNTPTHIDDPSELTSVIEGYLIRLGTHKHGPAMHMTTEVARWLAKELEMQAAEVEAKAARAMVENTRKVMER